MGSLANLKNNQEFEQVFEVLHFEKKYKLSALTREEFQDKPEILNKYFWNKVRSLDRFHVPEITKAEYESIVQTFKRTSRFDKANLKYETASAYYIRKARIALVAKDLNCSPYDIDTTDYIWDENMYLRYSFFENLVYVTEDIYRENDEDRWDKSSKEAYIDTDPRTTQIDEQLWEDLYDFCIKAVQQKKAMMLSKVENCISFLNSVLEYTHGFAENGTKFQQATLQSYADFFAELFKDEDFVQWFESTTDEEVFGEDELTHSDYVQTYEKLLKQIKQEETIEFEPLYDNGEGEDCEDDETEEIMLSI